MGTLGCISRHGFAQIPQYMRLSPLPQKQNGLVATILSMALGIAGCSDINFDMGRYKGAVKDGFAKIPQACQIEELLGEADHFISYHGTRDIPQQWNTEVYFAGRYCLTMQVVVKVDRNFSRITEVVGEPTFHLNELTSIDRTANGSDSAACGQQWVFTLDDWNKVVKAKGDFSVIGIRLKQHQPVPGFDRFVRSVRALAFRFPPEIRAKSGDAIPILTKWVCFQFPA